MAQTIVEKLKLNKYKQIVVWNIPEGHSSLSDLHPFDTSWKQESYDLIFAFVLDMLQLQQMVKDVLDHQRLQKDGYLYLAYPKKGNKVYDSYIHRDHLFEGLGADEDGYVQGTHLKFSRMVGLDDVFTVVGLKFDEPKAKSSQKASQSVNDYIVHISDIEADLMDVPELLAIYQSLTEGYRKDWARYVYSAKQEATQQKRKAEMKEILQAGYKTRELYMRDKRK